MTKKNKIEKIINRKAYTIQNGAYCFLAGDRTPQKTSGQGFLGNIQNCIKKHGRIYYFMLRLFAPVFPSLIFQRAIKKYLKKYSENHFIVNLGSGPQYFKNRKDIINVDLFAFDEVDIIADSACLPIFDQSVDFVLNLALLEHTRNPQQIVCEMRRILKPGGEILAYVPFIVPFHPAPNDYYRWTRQGVKELFSGFDSSEIFVGCGPTSGMLYIFQEWAASLLSFGSRTLHDIWFLILLGCLFPVKYLDLFLEKIPHGSNIASGFGINAMKH